MSQLRSFDRRPWLILCEGESDKRFFDQLIHQRGITPEFQIRFPSRGADNRGGRSKFGPWLDTACNVSGWSHVKGVLIVSDNDDNHEASFKEVTTSLQSGNWAAIPNSERVVQKSTGAPPTVILMLPSGGAPGSIETMCLTAADSKWPSVSSPLAAFVQAVGVTQWSANKQAKMRLQCTLAATCLPRPDAGFVGHWWEDQQYHIPTNDPVFDDIAGFLSGFGTIIASA